MLENSKMGRFRQVFKHIFTVIRGHRPANLDQRGKPVDDYKCMAQYGRSMIEMLGVLAIIGVLSIGGIAGYSKAMEKFKVNKTIDEVTTIVSNLRTLYANQKHIEDLDYTYNETDLTILKDFIFPAETWVGKENGYFKHALGGELYVITDYENNAFYVSLLGLSKEACTTLGAYDWGGNSSGFAAIVVMEKMDGDPGAEIIDCLSENFTADDFSNRKGGVSSCRRVHNLPLPLTPDLSAKGCACTTNTCAIEILFEEK